VIRRHLVALRLALMAADGISAAALFALVAVVRYGTTDPTALSAWLALDVDRAALLYGVGWVSVLSALNLYRLRARWTLRAEFRDILRATAIMAAATLILLFLFKLDVVSRLFLVGLFGGQIVLTTLSRAILRGLFSLYRERGYNLRYMLIVGAGKPAQEFADTVESFKALGIKVVGHLAGPGDAKPRVTRPVIGSIEAIEEVMHNQVVDEVAVCLTYPDPEVSQEITALCALEGRNVRIPLHTLALAQEGRIEEFEGNYVISLSFGPARAVSLLAKQVLDVALAAAGLVILSPVMLAIALRIRIIDGAPVLFRQTRVGLHGREFTVYKFRTMVVDAETRRAELEHLNERNRIVFKITQDPRITRTGRFLRAASLDELPQLWNVLLGQMSIVGPRPPLPHEVKQYDVWHRRRLSMKPGITGLWQIEARNHPDFDKWVERDLSYIDRWSLWLDIKIIAKTVPAVLMRAGR
jgi:exopolysaccharide biosynthesis polyprenyl glycosylphosphotransferase